MDNTNRLDALIDEAELRHEIARINSDSGNREFESTAASILALRNAKETLLSEDDPTKTQTSGIVYKKRLLLKALGAELLLAEPDIQHLHLGSEEELVSEGTNLVCEPVILERISGTRIDILRAFLDRYGNKK